jgi:hypothetical protein
MSDHSVPSVHGETTEADAPTTIRVQRSDTPHRIQAFNRLADVVDRAYSAEVPAEPPPETSTFVVYARPPEGRRPGSPDLDARDALARAEAEHEAAIAESHRCWEQVHALQDEVARLAEEERAALRAFELAREGRRRAERRLREARAESDEASRRCVIASQVRETARIRAERL